MNIYVVIDYSLSNCYFYYWLGVIGGIGMNCRVGLYYFCLDLVFFNCGNFYFVYFWIDNNMVQIYKVINDMYLFMDQMSFMFIVV